MITRLTGSDFPKDKWVRDLLSRINEIIEHLKGKVTRDRLATDVTSVLSPITTKGDLVVGGTLGVTERLAIGTDGQVFTSDGTTAGWESLPVATASQTGVLSRSPAYAASGLLYGLAPPITPQTSLTVTTNAAGWVTGRAVGIAYADINGVWRLRFNVQGNFTSRDIKSNPIVVTFNGVAFKAVIAQPITAITSSSDVVPRVHTDGTTIYANAYQTSPVTGLYMSGDVELDGKPSWA